MSGESQSPPESEFVWLSDSEAKRNRSQPGSELMPTLLLQMQVYLHVLRVLMITSVLTDIQDSHLGVNSHNENDNENSL